MCVTLTCTCEIEPAIGMDEATARKGRVYLADTCLRCDHQIGAQADADLAAVFETECLGRVQGGQA